MEGHEWDDWEERPRADGWCSFRYKGGPAGSFLDGITPTEPGIYAYMPFRSYAHYAMGKAVEAGEKPVCTYKSPAGTVSFQIIARHRGGRLELDNFNLANSE